MLPKEILKYARKFSPVEIENAIKRAIDAIGKTIIGRTPDSVDWRTLQEYIREQAGLASPWGQLTAGTTHAPFNAYTAAEIQSLQQWATTTSTTSSGMTSYTL